MEVLAGDSPDESSKFEEGKKVHSELFLNNGLLDVSGGLSYNGLINFQIKI